MKNLLIFTVILLILILLISCQPAKESGNDNNSKNTSPSYPEKMTEFDGIWSWPAGGETLTFFSVNINDSFLLNDTIVGANGFIGTMNCDINARNETLNQIKFTITNGTGDYSGGNGHNIYIKYDLVDANTLWYAINYAGVYPADGHVYGPFIRIY